MCLCDGQVGGVHLDVPWFVGVEVPITQSSSGMVGPIDAGCDEHWCGSVVFEKVMRLVGVGIGRAKHVVCETAEDKADEDGVVEVVVDETSPG